MKISSSPFYFGSMAKLNLGLTVLGKLPTGARRIDTIMTRIPLYDQVCLHWQNKNKNIKIVCDHPLVPLTSANLLYKAYEILQAQFDLPGVVIELDKNIPVGSGLGGGCFNAGILIKQLNHHLKLKISPANLRKLGLKIGDSVAFATSRTGSVYERDHGLFNMSPLMLPSLPACRLALAFSNFTLDKEEVFRHLETIDFIPSEQNKLLQAIEAKDLVGIAQNLNNDFAVLIYQQHPELLQIREQFLAAGALGVGLTGHGPTLFALFPPGQKIEVPFKITTLELKEKTNIRPRS